jgi:hypothetical protein
MSMEDRIGFTTVPLLSDKEVEKRKETQHEEQKTAPSTPKIIYIWDEQLGKFTIEGKPNRPAVFGVYEHSTFNIKQTQFPKINRDITGHPVVV